jgi:hypothetical protein
MASRVLSDRQKYLDVFNRRTVATVTFCVVARGRERVGVERDQRATTRVCDVDARDRDCGDELDQKGEDSTTSRAYAHRVWSLK